MGLIDRLRAAGRAFARPQANVNSSPPARRPDLPFVVRAGMAGALPGHYISDHFRELESCVEWVWVASSNKAKQYAQSTPSVKVPDTVRKAFQSAPDAPDDNKSSQPNHPLLRLLKRPNPLTSGPIFMYQIGLQIELTGGCVIWERRNQLGLPAELWVLPRGWLFFQNPTHEYPFGYWRVTPSHTRWSGWYAGPMGQLTQWNLDIRDTIQVGWPSPLYPGEFQSSLAACSRLIDVATQTETAVAARMRNSIMPSVLLSIVSQNGQGDSLVQEQIEQLKAQVVDYYAGADNAGKAIIANNVGLEPIGQSMEEMQGTESRKQAREFVLNVFGVPPSAIGAVEETSYAAFSAAMKAYTSLSIDPVNMIVGEQFSHRWQSIWPGVEVHFDARVYDDPQMQAQRAGGSIFEAVGAGYATPNEWRVAMSLPRRDDCDELVKPQPVGMPGMDGAAPPMPGAPPPDAGGDFDLDLDVDDMGDATRTGFKRPDLSVASGNRIPSHLLNGVGGH